MRQQVSDALVGLYDRLSRSGILARPRARRAFESAYLAYKGLYEAGPVDGLRCLIPAGSTVIDVGANIGFFTLRFARWTGPSGRVVAIEPEARNIASLRARVESAGLSRTVECIEAVAADRPGELRLALTPGHPGDHHLANDGQPVRAVTLDGLVAGDPRAVSLIKIDVQGAEMLVLSGARELLATQRPAIHIEVDGPSLARMGSSPRELIDSLVELGFRPRQLSRYGAGAAEDVDELVSHAWADYIDVLFR